MRQLNILILALTLISTQAAADPRAKFLGASTADMGNPHDIKLSPDGRHLFVSDVERNRVLILDAQTLAPVGSFGADRQRGTHDVDFDGSGRLLVADTHNNRVLIYRMNGIDAEFETQIKGGFRGPEGVLAHPNGRIYIAGAWSDNVVAIADGKRVGELTGLAAPHDLELAPNGDIWLADADNDRMLRLSPDLKIVAEWRGSAYGFDGVRYQDVLPDGTVIAADKHTHSVKVISETGKLLLTIGTGKPGKGPGVFTTPEGVETRGETLWISDSGNDRIVKYRLTFD